MIRKQKTRAWLLSLAAVVLLMSNYFVGWAEEPDPNILWQSEKSYTGFVIKPNGNIIANKNLEFFELDGNTGKVIKTFPIFCGPNDHLYDISPDGKLLAAAYDGIILFDLVNSKTYDTLTIKGGIVKFFPDNNKLLIRTLNRPDSNLAIYDISKKTYTFFGPPAAVTNIGVSPNGKYFATGGTEGDGQQYTKLTLWDAQTLKPIKEFLSLKGGFEIGNIKFSEDSKLVGFNVYIDILYIYNTESYSLYKQYNNVYDFCFINNDYLGLKSGYATVMQMFNDNIVFKSKLLNQNSIDVAGYNHKNNSFVTGNTILRAWNLNYIFSDVKDTESSKNFTANYSQDTITISNSNFNSPALLFRVFDVNGKLIKQMELAETNSEIKIPIKLTNGTYILQIQDGSQQYTSKFLVME